GGRMSNGRGGTALDRRDEPPPLRPDQSLFLDFDGTLVEIASAPHLVRVPAELPRLLAALDEQLGGAVAVVSGRPLDELARMLAPFPGPIVGSHGLERRGTDGNVASCLAAPKLERFRSLIAAFAERHDGVVFEDKGCTLALHYRQAPSVGVLCEALVRQ